MKVECSIEETEVEGDYGPVDGLCITCGRCDHTVEVFGTSEASMKRGFCMLKEECPNGESNFYVEE